VSRIELLEPQGELDAALALDAMLLVEGGYSAEYVSKVMSFLEMLTKLELQVIYDWAMREHLRASDNNIRRRERPGLLKLIDKVWESVSNMETVIQDRDSIQARIDELEEENDVLTTRIAALEEQVLIAGGETPDVGEPSVH
jgi:hypothetical protein